MKEKEQIRIIDTAYELLLLQDLKFGQVDDRELVAKCFDLSKEFAKQVDEFLSN